MKNITPILMAFFAIGGLYGGLHWIVSHAETEWFLQAWFVELITGMGFWIPLLGGLVAGKASESGGAKNAAIAAFAGMPLILLYSNWEAVGESVAYIILVSLQGGVVAALAGFWVSSDGSSSNLAPQVTAPTRRGT